MSTDELLNAILAEIHAEIQRCQKNQKQSWTVRARKFHGGEVSGLIGAIGIIQAKAKVAGVLLREGE